MTVKADLHVHSIYSRDSIITPEELVFYARKRGLTAVAITDHDQVEGARKIARETGFLIIPGTEVSSSDGHIVGLCVREAIPKGLNSQDTVDLIHKAGGIAIACHPYALFKGSVGKYVTRDFDAVETRNASSFPFKTAAKRADLLANCLNLPKVAGTDAHIPQSIGRAYTLIDVEPEVEAIIEAIFKGRCEPMGDPLTLSTRVQNQIRFLKKYIRMI